MMWRVLSPILFSGSTLLGDPLHSTSVPFSAGVAVPLSVDVKEVALVPGPKPVSALAVKTLPGPQIWGAVELCARAHTLLPFPTFQVVTPLMSPVTVHVKVKVSPGQVGEAAVNCPVTSPREKYITLACAILCRCTKEIVWFLTSQEFLCNLREAICTHTV